MHISRVLTLSLLTSLIAFSAHAQYRQSAEYGMYGEVGYAPIDINSDAGGTSTPKAVRFIVGKDINPNLSIEGMYITTMSKDGRTGYDGNISNYGVSLKPKTALTANTELFARAGWGHSDITASIAGARAGEDFTYGVGLQTNITKTVYAQVDYMNYYLKDGLSAKGYTLSLGTRF
jgi:opacity protein-like surface antigen